jgi:aspartyl-tRNA(Asn)/glutamyl-tRNA(Gln) amidotransferase subunit A
MTGYTLLSKVQEDLESGKLTCEALTRHYIAEAKAQAYLNAFIEIFEDSALSKAREVDQKITSGANLGKLFGLVIGIKDNIVYKGHQSTASSKILEGFTSVYSSTAVERLLQADAIIIGRLGSDEFAMGSSNETSVYGPVRNPVNPEYVPGGSSGGSAAAVKAGLCLASLGSDTGGSIRQPAAFCGLIGFKPTYGRVSRYGLIAYGSSFDQIGPLTHTVEDAARIMEVIAGADEYDATSSSKQVEQYSSHLNNNGNYRIAYYKDAVEHPSIDPEVRQATANLIAILKANGHTVEPVDFKTIDFIVPAYYVLTTAEASSNLSRFDGVRYGYHHEGAQDLETTYRLSRSTGFGKEVQRRIMSGTFVLSAGYYDAYYSKAQKVRRILVNETNATLSQYDFILCPTTPSPAFKIGEMSDDPIAMYLGDIFTVQANLVGVPAVSLPVAESKAGLPIGLQLMAGKFEEGKLLQFSQQVMNLIKS